MNINIVLGTIPSDSHSWNLMYLELLLNELECNVIQLGICTPVECYQHALVNQTVDLIVMSSLNGHGFSQGKEVVQSLRQLYGTTLPPVVIGGMLRTNNDLNSQHKQQMIEAGFSRVYDGDNAIAEFISDIQYRSQRLVSL